jgi:hypothetical protein
MPRIASFSLAKTPEEVRREWDEADDNLVLRTILSRYLKAVIIRKTGRRGPGDLYYSAIEPVWREDGEYTPIDLVIYYRVCRHWWGSSLGSCAGVPGTPQGMTRSP